MEANEQVHALVVLRSIGQDAMFFPQADRFIFFVAFVFFVFAAAAVLLFLVVPVVILIVIRAASFEPYSSDMKAKQERIPSDPPR